MPSNGYLDASEFIRKLNALTKREEFWLRKQGNVWALGTGMEWRDLLNEAISRTLANSRRCPANTSVAAYLNNAMRSIASAERKKLSRQVPLGNPGDETSLIEKLPVRTSSPADIAQSRIDLQRMYDRLQEIFHGDSQALAVVIGRMEGWSSAEIKEIESMEDNDFDAARKRARRAIEREFGRKDKS